MSLKTYKKRKKMSLRVLAQCKGLCYTWLKIKKKEEEKMMSTWILRTKTTEGFVEFKGEMPHQVDRQEKRYLKENEVKVLRREYYRNGTLYSRKTY